MLTGLRSTADADFGKVPGKPGPADIPASTWLRTDFSAHEERGRL